MRAASPAAPRSMTRSVSSPARSAMRSIARSARAFALAEPDRDARARRRARAARRHGPSARRQSHPTASRRCASAAPRCGRPGQGARRARPGRARARRAAARRGRSATIRPPLRPPAPSGATPRSRYSLRARVRSGAGSRLPPAARTSARAPPRSRTARPASPLRATNVGESGSLGKIDDQREAFGRRHGDPRAAEAARHHCRPAALGHHVAHVHCLSPLVEPVSAGPALALRGSAEKPFRSRRSW